MTSHDDRKITRRTRHVTTTGARTGQSASFGQRQPDSEHMNSPFCATRTRHGHDTDSWSRRTTDGHLVDAEDEGNGIVGESFYQDLDVVAQLLV